MEVVVCPPGFQMQFTPVAGTVVRVSVALVFRQSSTGLFKLEVTLAVSTVTVVHAETEHPEEVLVAMTQ